MMNEELLKVKLNELLYDEMFVKEMNATASYEDAAKVLTNHGIALNGEEVAALMVKAKDLALEKGLVQNGELTEETLETVAGGWGPKRRTPLYIAGEFLCVCALIGGGPVTWLGAAAVCGGAALLSMCW